MPKVPSLLLTCFAALAAASASAHVHPPPAVTTVAPGVLLFETPAYGDAGLDGNSVAIVGDDGVLVFDANGTPAAARRVIAELRRRTKLPVRYVVISHWHWDHTYGIGEYVAAFPGVRIVATEETRRLLETVEPEWNRAGLEEQLPGHVAQVKAAAKTDPGEMAHAAADAWFLAQKRAAKRVLPDVTFRERLTLRLGKRTVELRNDGAAVTPGDAWLWLPKEKIVVTGDLLVNPIPFALGCWPSGWLSELRRIREIGATAIVPGHGGVLRDTVILDAQIALMELLLREGKAGKALGENVETVRKRIAREVETLAPALTGGDARKAQQLDVYLVDWYLHRVFDEADEKLGDGMPEFPRHE